MTMEYRLGDAPNLTMFLRQLGGDRLMISEPCEFREIRKKLRRKYALILLQKGRREIDGNCAIDNGRS